jgi:hypothetical protein
MAKIASIEANFQAFYKNPVIATALNLVYHVAILPIDGSPANNRTDLMSILLMARCGDVSVSQPNAEAESWAQNVSSSPRNRSQPRRT